MNNCPQCQEDWSACQCPSWPGKFILFARPQVFWLLNTQFTFEGISGYTNEKVHKSKITGAPFEGISCIVGEIKARLARCGEAGEALVYEAVNATRIPEMYGKDEDGKIVIIHREEFIGLSDPAMRALNYCSGWRRRRQTYAEWRYDRERRGIKPPIDGNNKIIHA